MKKLFITLLVFTVSFIFLTGVVLAAGDSLNAEAFAVIDSHNQGSKIPMSVIAQDLKFPQLIPYFGPNNPGRRYTPLADILLYGNRFLLESTQANVSDALLREHDLTRITDPKILNKVMTVI